MIDLIKWKKKLEMKIIETSKFKQTQSLMAGQTGTYPVGRQMIPVTILQTTTNVGGIDYPEAVDTTTNRKMVIYNPS